MQTKVDIDEVIKLAKTLVASRLFSVGSVEEAVGKILAGQELGIGPVAALTHVYCSETRGGRRRLGLEAVLVGALLRARGYRWEVVEHTAERCSLRFLSGQGREIGVASYSLADARAAGIAQRDPWVRAPRNMLYWRALTLGARYYCAEVFGGIAAATPDEIAEVPDDAPEPAVVPVPPVSPVLPGASVPEVPEVPEVQEVAPVVEEPPVAAGRVGRGNGAPPRRAAALNARLKSLPKADPQADPQAGL